MKTFLIKGWRPLLVLLLLFIHLGSILLKYLNSTMATSLHHQTYLLRLSKLERLLSSTSFVNIQLSVIGFLIGTCHWSCYSYPITFNSIFKRMHFIHLLILSQNIPTIVLAPLLVIWFGFGMLPKIIVITLVCFFPVTVAALMVLNKLPQN